MARTQFTIVWVAIIFSLTVCYYCMAADEVKCHVTGDVEIQWPGGGGGGCGGSDGGDCGGSDGGD